MLQSLVDAKPEQIVEVVTTNLLGSLLATRAAIQLMGEQPTSGHIFNVDGAGADGSPTPQYAAYGATKSGEQWRCRMIRFLQPACTRLLLSVVARPCHSSRLSSSCRRFPEDFASHMSAGTCFELTHDCCESPTGVAHMMGSLKAELQAADSSVSVHTISPGMVLTGAVFKL